MYCVSRVFKDAKLVTMLESFVRLMPEGLSIGLRSSQGLGKFAFVCVSGPLSEGQVCRASFLPLL